MTIYFAWHREGEPFDHKIHARCDLDILELTIDHREGEVAMATVVVPHLELPRQNQRYVYISDEETLIYSGRLVGLPAKITNDLVSLELTAEPLDAGAQLQNLKSELKQSPFWDSCFVDPIEEDNPSEWLEARSALFAWDRLHGTVCISDLFQGRHLLDFSDKFFADSLKVSIAETPLSLICVNLTAEWIQQGAGEVSLGRKIAAAFPEGIINTLTPQALQSTWPQEGQKLGKSGFWVLKSSLRQVIPPKTGILRIYPTLTPEFMLWDDFQKVVKPSRVRRIWMLGDLLLGWRYRQKRREVLRFELAQRTQLDGSIRPLSRTLNLQLQQSKTTSESTFFLTHRGRQAVEHAMEVARAHLAASARCLEVEITLPLEAGYALSMDHSVRLVDSRIPGGEVVGKIVAYRLHQDGIKSFTWVRFAASIGGEAQAPFPLEYDHYAEPSYANTARARSYQTATGIVYADYFQQQPTHGLTDIKNLSLLEILKGVIVSHDAEKQIQTLQRQQYPVRHNLKGVLEEVPTSLSLNLLSLKTQSVAEHFIYVKTIGFWTAPKQINLSNGVS